MALRVGVIAALVACIALLFLVNRKRDARKALEEAGPERNEKQAARSADSCPTSEFEKYKAEWANAIRSVADPTECPKYKGLKIRPQLGLIPIGRDVDSGLWEFAHLQTTAPVTSPIPIRFSTGRIVLTDSIGLVFVLIPGGTFRMGAAKPVEGQALTDPNVDPEADEGESPTTEIRLDPFFLSKYEMTQAQWLRVAGENPSGFFPIEDFPNVTLLNPVEQVSWEQCDLWLGRLGLILPTEAQWEYAARGGTTTPTWIGLGKDGLARAANLADASCRLGGFPPDWKYESWDDGYSGHAPVGSFEPNSFGLHDVLGNVGEWCRDWYGSYEVAADSGDGLRHPSEPLDRVERGRSFDCDASGARSASRGRGHPSVERSAGLGVRPARRLLPASAASESR